jgi:UDP-glucose 4-epimerase
MKNILVTGGAGYIGSFMVKRLIDDGFTVTVLDNLNRGNENAVDKRAILKIGDIVDTNFVSNVLSEQSFDAVIHFAGLISVGESMTHPDDYFRNNTLGSFILFEKMRENNIKNIIFSSTAGVYGNPKTVPIPEDHQKLPESPYGESKLLVESGLDWYSRTFGINFVILRYFNAAGGSLDGSMGENHKIESHIIPNLIKSIFNDREFTLFGNDYNTHDGTCVRDYIHVLDLVEAHILALKKLETESGRFVYNAGTGEGYSNKQVIDAVERVTGNKIKLRIEARRRGDADVLIADNSRIKNGLHFNPLYSQLDVIIESAWKWHNKNG